MQKKLEQCVLKGNGSSRDRKDEKPGKGNEGKEVANTGLA